ncbi:MAG: amidohydrolase family protein [Planctomycetaceae bacterium]|nr:amidohydrolase family protein [Planctomycetaceae bacterium]
MATRRPSPAGRRTPPRPRGTSARRRSSTCSGGSTASRCTATRREIAAHGAAVCTWADWWGFKMEARDGIPQNAALCQEAGVTVCVHSDSSEQVQRLWVEAAKMVGAGLPRAEAVKALTINPATVIGVEGRIGSLEAGKDADLALFSGDPFSVLTRVDATWIEGRRVFERERR